MKTCASIQNNLGYVGEVTFKHKLKDGIIVKEVHNTGTQNLFDIITQFLAGYDMSKHIPKYIGIFRSNTNNNEHLTGNIPVTGIVWGSAANSNYNATSNIGYLKLTATIIESDKKFEVSSNEEIDVCLMSEQGETLCVVQTTGSLLTNVTEAQDAIVEWLLVFGNGENN